jgi:hypothetical protein
MKIFTSIYSPAINIIDLLLEYTIYVNSLLLFEAQS